MPKFILCLHKQSDAASKVLASSAPGEQGGLSPIACSRFYRFSLFGLGWILASALSSCIASKPLTMSSGSPTSGYGQISEQVIASASRVGNLTVEDNYNSKGSLQNLERLLNGEVDFALLQLDVARQAMRERKIQAVVVLANEYLQIVTRADDPIQTFGDLQQKRVAVGATGSGIAFTSERLFSSLNLEITEDRTSLREALEKLRAEAVDAVVYVGPIGTNEAVRLQITEDAELSLLGLEASLVNYLAVQFPESYQSATIPQGSYKALPAKPSQDLSTISTATALVTRPDVDQNTVALLTWSILSTARKYAPFYPQIATGDAQDLLKRGLVYLHPGAIQALEYGDPQQAWLRYLQQNAPLQAALIMLTATSTIGFTLRWWRKRRSNNIIKTSRQSVKELRSLLEESPQTALENVEQLRQQQRLMLIDGSITPEDYEQVERMTRVLADQCRAWQQQQYKTSVQHTLKLVDDLQVKLRTEPEDGLKQINQVEQQFQELLLAGKVDIETYILIKQLTLNLISCFVPQEDLLAFSRTSNAQLLDPWVDSGDRAVP